MSETCTIEIAIPEQLIEQLADRVADRVRASPRQAGALEHTTSGESPWMTVREAAAYLGCSRHTLYRHTAAKTIPFRKRHGGQGLLFRRDELDRWVEASYEIDGVRL